MIDVSATTTTDAWSSFEALSIESEPWTVVGGEHVGDREDVVARQHVIADGEKAAVFENPLIGVDVLIDGE